MQPLRMAVTGEAGGPELVDVLELIGKEEVVKRLKTAVETLATK